MASPSPKRHPTPTSGHGEFTTALRFELIDSEERALLGSYAIASAIGLAFLLLVQFGPHVPPPLAKPFVVEIPDFNPGGTFNVPTEIPAQNGVATGRRVVGGGLAATSVKGAISRAFGGSRSAIVGQPTNILGGVVVTRPGSTTAETGGKTVLAHGEGGVSSIAPNRGGIGAGSGTGTDIGGVRGGGNVSHSAVRVEALPVIAADPLTPAGDVATIGTFVRGHESQLRFCYEEHGLRTNSTLAGSVTIAMNVGSNGGVSSAAVTKRSWSGPGAVESEACILRAIRGWRLPASAAGAGTYSLPFNFSR